MLLDLILDRTFDKAPAVRAKVTLSDVYANLVFYCS